MKKYLIKNINIKQLILILILLFLMGCIGSQPQQNQYLINYIEKSPEKNKNDDKYFFNEKDEVLSVVYDKEKDTKKTYIPKDKQYNLNHTLNNKKEVRKKSSRGSFPAREYRNLMKNGDNILSGYIYLYDYRNDKKVFSKKAQIYLNPVTSYSREWYNKSYLKHISMPKADKRLINYLKFTTSNNNGKFNFYGIAKGSYYLVASVKCGNLCKNNKTIIIAKKIYISAKNNNSNLYKNINDIFY